MDEELSWKAKGRALTGVWIETSNIPAGTPPPLCRALTGVWIETANCLRDSKTGLRRALTGVWIETSIRKDSSQVLKSRPYGRVD